MRTYKLHLWILLVDERKPGGGIVASQESEDEHLFHLWVMSYLGNCYCCLDLTPAFKNMMLYMDMLGVIIKLPLWFI
jgi:hypothetical protein